MHWIINRVSKRRTLAILFFLVSLLLVTIVWRWYQVHVVKVDRFYSLLASTMLDQSSMPVARLNLETLGNEFYNEIAIRLSQETRKVYENISDNALQMMIETATQWLQDEEKLAAAVHVRLRALNPDQSSWTWLIDSNEEKIIALESECLYLGKHNGRWQLKAIAQCSVSVTEPDRLNEEKKD